MLLSVVVPLSACVSNAVQVSDPSSELERSELELSEGEALVALNVTFAQPAMNARFYSAGPVTQATPNSTYGPWNLLFSVRKGGIQLRKVPAGWFRLGGVDYMMMQRSLSLYCKLVPKAINYVGDVAVEGNSFYVNGGVMANEQSVALIQSRFPRTHAKYRVVRNPLAPVG